MMILALCSLPERLGWNSGATLAQVEKLAEGVCRQQNVKSGKFKIYFVPPGMNNSGWELYSGEAELALATAYGAVSSHHYLHAAQRAFAAYQKDYTLNRVRTSSFIFFVNWQCQAARALLRYTKHLGDVVPPEEILQHILQLQDEVVFIRNYFDEVSRAPDQVSVVEVACALDGLVAAYQILLSFQESRAPEESEEYKTRRVAYENAINIAVQFLLRAQIGPGLTSRGVVMPEEAVGGFGYGVHEPTQRIDVTGHVCSAFLKIMEVLEKQYEDDQLL